MPLLPHQGARGAKGIPTGSEVLGEGTPSQPRDPGSAVRAVVFDLDGTLADDLDLIYATFIAVYRQFTGRSYTPSEIRATFGPTEEAMMRHAVPDHANACIKRFFQLYESGWNDRPRATPAMRSLLQWLRSRGYAVGVATGGGPRRTPLTLRLLGFDALVDVVLTGGAEGSNKAESLARLAQDWNLEPRQLAYFGDSKFDMRDALVAGAIPLGAAWYEGGDTADTLREAGAAEVFTKVRDVVDWLNCRL